VDCRPTVARLQIQSPDSRPTPNAVGGQTADSPRSAKMQRPWTVGRQSPDSRPTVARLQMQSAVRPPTVGRQSMDFAFERLVKNAFECEYLHWIVCVYSFKCKVLGLSADEVVKEWTRSFFHNFVLGRFLHWEEINTYYSMKVFTHKYKLGRLLSWLSYQRWKIIQSQRAPKLVIIGLMIIGADFHFWYRGAVKNLKQKQKIT
jgi:hypothetical protein